MQSILPSKPVGTWSPGAGTPPPRSPETTGLEWAAERKWYQVSGSGWHKAVATPGPLGDFQDSSLCGRNEVIVLGWNRLPQREWRHSPGLSSPISLPPSLVMGWPNTLLPFTREQEERGREGENLYIKWLFLIIPLAWVWTPPRGILSPFSHPRPLQKTPAQRSASLWSQFPSDDASFSTLVSVNKQT